VRYVIDDNFLPRKTDWTGRNNQNRRLLGQNRHEIQYKGLSMTDM
jgi:hypothetical protein